MLTYMFELWWGSYKAPHPEDVRTQNFQDAFEAGYKYGLDIGRVQGYKHGHRDGINVQGVWDGGDF